MYWPCNCSLAEAMYNNKQRRSGMTGRGMAGRGGSSTHNRLGGGFKPT